MENKYEYVIHNTTTLILQNKPQRAIPILKKMISLGIQTVQIYILLSYAVKQVQGQVKAVNILKNCPNKSPLINMAIAQYTFEIKSYVQCLNNINQILCSTNKDKSKQISNQHKQLNNNISLIQQVKQKVCTLIDINKPLYSESIQETNIDIKLINQINTIIQSLKREKISKKQAKLEFESLYYKHKPKGKIELYLKKFMQYLSYSK